METLTRVRAVGGSLIVTIPKEIVREMSVKEGELVKVKLEKVKIDGFGLLKGIEKFTRKDRMEDRF